MSLFHHSVTIMYLCTILSLLICLQLASAAPASGKKDSVRVSASLARSSMLDSSEINSRDQVNLALPLENPFDQEVMTNSGSDSDEETDAVRRSTSFLRFGRQVPASSGSFLRFGRSNPSFLRFGRNGGQFLRFGRRSERASNSNFLRFGRKGEFLRFG